MTRPSTTTCLYHILLAVTTACILDATSASISESVLRKHKKKRNNINNFYISTQRTFSISYVRKRGATCDKQLPFVIHQNVHMPYRSAIRRTFLPYTKGIFPWWACVRERSAYGVMSLECSSYTRHTSCLPMAWDCQALVVGLASWMQPYSAISNASAFFNVTFTLGNSCCALPFKRRL